MRARAQDWLQQHGPFDAVLDGANLALWGQNVEAGAWCFAQVRAALAQLRADGTGMRPLLVRGGNPGRGPALLVARPSARCRVAAGRTLLRRMTSQGDMAMGRVRANGCLGATGSVSDRSGGVRLPDSLPPRCLCLPSV